MFAEGTFRRAPGLLAFHLGAFSVAVQAGVAVTPMAIRGTRELLPDGIWWPRRSALDLVAGEPLQAPVGAADEFAAAARLMRSSREFVLRSLGEADAAHVVVPV
jgi:1-acyl-sn-glycerol-3-phosphate acyltransferase